MVKKDSIHFLKEANGILLPHDFDASPPSLLASLGVIVPGGGAQPRVIMTRHACYQALLTCQNHVTSMGD